MSSRRHFLKVSMLAGGGLVMQGILPRTRAQEEEADPLRNPFFIFEVQPGNRFLLTIAKHEMGQGTTSSLAALFADELGLDWEQLALKESTWDASSTPGMLALFRANTGGSTGTIGSWDSMRLAGATLRQMFVTAAAKQFKKDADSLLAKGGYVEDSDAKQRISLYDLAETTSLQELPTNPRQKSFEELRLVGRELPSLRLRELVSGAVEYGVNVRRDNMLYASIERCPYFLGTLKRFDSEAALAMSGVVDVFSIEGKVLTRPDSSSKAGVVVLADSTWHAERARSALQIEWDGGSFEDYDLDEEFRRFGRLPESERGEVLRTRGNVEAAFEAADRVVSAEYANQHQAHCCLEPLNATAEYRDGKMEIWVGTQCAENQVGALSEALGIRREDVIVHKLPSGGSFGRRYFTDFVVEAALIAKRVSRPVKVTWTREDAMRHDHFHYAQLIRMEAAIDKEGMPSAYKFGGHRRNLYSMLPVEERSYGPRIAVQTGAWRSVRSHYETFALESFMDELAFSLGKDPLEFRMETVAKMKVPPRFRFLTERLTRVLEELKKRTDWGRDLPKGRGLGVAICRFTNTICGQVAEVEVEGDTFRVVKVTVVTDSGKVLNPQMARGQIEGSIVWAHSALMGKGIDVRGGKVAQSNFHDYPICRIGEVPELDIELLRSDGPIGGFGEPAVPPYAPAVLNAYYSASGRRIRTVPIGWNVLEDV